MEYRCRNYLWSTTTGKVKVYKGIKTVGQQVLYAFITNRTSSLLFAESFCIIWSITTFQIPYQQNAIVCLHICLSFVKLSDQLFFIYFWGKVPLVWNLGIIWNIPCVLWPLIFVLLRVGKYFWIGCETLSLDRTTALSVCSSLREELRKSWCLQLTRLQSDLSSFWSCFVSYYDPAFYTPIIAGNFRYHYLQNWGTPWASGRHRGSCSLITVHSLCFSIFDCFPIEVTLPLGGS